MPGRGGDTAGVLGWAVRMPDAAGHWTRSWRTEGGNPRHRSVGGVRRDRAARHPGIPFEVGSFRDCRSMQRPRRHPRLVLADPQPAAVPDILAEFAECSPRRQHPDRLLRRRAARAVRARVAPAYFWSADALAEVLADAGFEVVARETRGREPGEIDAWPLVPTELIARRVPWCTPTRREERA